MNIQDYIARNDITVSAAMQMINANAGGTIFLTDEVGKLKGCISDGDIRRYLLAGGQMDGDALNAANKEPRYAKTRGEAKKLFHKNKFLC